MVLRSFSLVMALVLGLFVVACEVEDDTADGVSGDTITGDMEEDTTPVDPCPGGCNATCAAAGTFDVDCYPSQAECKDAVAQTILTDWFNGSFKDQMSPNTRNCDWTVGICDAQFRCDQRACFCDPDCYDDAADPMAPMPACAADGHCDTWCPVGIDADCAGNADEGKYCNG